MHINLVILTEISLLIFLQILVNTLDSGHISAHLCFGLMPMSESISHERFEDLRIQGTPFLTTEVRWFAAGAPPQQIIDWFAQGGEEAVVELRCDAYRRLNGPNVGLKRRDNGPLELKQRFSVASARPFALGLSGRIEEWCKTGLAEPPATTNWEWSVVDKVVLTRTFVVRDEAIVEVETREMTVPACDIELATVTVGESVAWSFALEAWGPEAIRRSLLDRALETLAGDLAPAPPGFVAALSWNMGYPEWLSSIAWDDQPG